MEIGNWNGLSPWYAAIQNLQGFWDRSLKKKEKKERGNYEVYWSDQTKKLLFPSKVFPSIYSDITIVLKLS